MNAKIEKRPPALFILCFLGVITYISLIFNNNLWVDEAFTACIVRRSFFDMLSATIADTLPPFYNVFAWCVTSVLGFNSVTLKLCSVIPMILLLLWLIPFKVRKHFGYFVSFFFAICVIALPHFLHYGVEIRMYSWALFASTAAGVFCYEAIITGEKASLIPFSLFTILSAATHYYALLCCAPLWVFMFVFCLKNSGQEHSGTALSLRSFILTALLTFVLYIPFMILTVLQLTGANSHFSMQKVSFKVFLADLRFPFVTNFTPLSLILLALFAFVFIVAIYAIFKGDRTLKTYFSVLYASVTYIVLLLSYIISLLRGNNFFTSRYLVPSLGLLWLGVSIGISILYEKDRRFAILIMIPLISLFVIYRQEYVSEYNPGVNAMTAYFDSHLKPGDGYVIYEDKYQIEICMRYYYPDFKKHSWENADEITGDAYYLLVPGFEEFLEEAPSQGYEAEFITDMNFDSYSFGLYKLHR
ncbi:MAG: glycosyltransferase family 39 protein [Lachnospiraceae bacterium]|nr:glycosyltransferase family 39 protein [Lachnospiraceae bacterium]